MLKVLIADDEELVRQLIRRLVDWESLGLKIIAEAENGYQAYDLLVEYVPDIVIVDIRMPGFDGLTLIHKTRELNLNVHFMLISGYKQFEYAHEALTLGIQDYILKPIRKDELTRSLIRIRDAILAANEIQQTHATLCSMAELSSAKLRSQLLKDMVLHQFDSTGLSVPQVNQEYSFHFSEGVFQFLFCKENGSHGQKDAVIYDKSLLAHLFKEILTPLCHDVEYYFFNHRFCFLLNYASGRSIAVNSALKSLFQNIPNALSLCSCQPFTLAVGTPVTQISALCQAFHSADCSLNRRFFKGTSQILPPVIQSSSIALADLISKSDERKFSELFELGDGENLKKWMLSVLSRAFAHEEDPSLIIELSYRLVDMFYKSAKLLQRRNDVDDGSKANIYERIACADSRNDLVALLSSMIEEWYDMSTSSGSAYVRFAKEYIKANYKNDIRLSMVAQAENINPAYLSRIFSDETGETFSDYLICYRMQAAKELLCDINVNVSEAAEQVGYHDVKHFSKSFKKIVGISPKDYRKLHAR